MSHFVGYHCLPSLSFTILFYLYNFYYHIIDHSGYFFHIFNLSLQTYRDFHKSFRNLPKFFREHARGARAIFHLWPAPQVSQVNIGFKSRFSIFADSSSILSDLNSLRSGSIVVIFSQRKSSLGSAIFESRPSSARLWMSNW